MEPEMVRIPLEWRGKKATLNQSCFDEIYGENNRYITAFYQDDNIYEVGYFDGIVYYIEESMIENTP